MSLPSHFKIIIIVLTSSALATVVYGPADHTHRTLLQTRTSGNHQSSKDEAAKPSEDFSLIDQLQKEFELESSKSSLDHFEQTDSESLPDYEFITPPEPTADNQIFKEKF